MGSADTDTNAQDWERPQYSMWLPEYLIGKHEVTAAQYRRFVQASDYQTSDPIALNASDDLPVAWVNWHDAQAFCDWATKATGRQVRLPSEAQWKKAGRGTDGRIYPWGNNEANPNLCNFSNPFGVNQGTAPVGHYSPLGDSPYGCADMAGNVWEWTRSLYKPYPYSHGDEQEDIGAGDDIQRVVLGESFYNDDRNVRCAARLSYLPLYHLDHLGFRVTVSHSP